MSDTIEIGAHSPNLAGALLQMSAPPYPISEIYGDVRALDINRAIVSIHSELALLRCEIQVLRIGVAAHFDVSDRIHTETRELDAGIAAHRDRLEYVERRMVQHLDERMELFRELVAAECAAVEARVADHTRQLSTYIQAIPDTYFWPRFKRRLRGLVFFWRRNDGI